jgi:hypothetical protein
MKIGKPLLVIPAQAGIHFDPDRMGDDQTGSRLAPG